MTPQSGAFSYYTDWQRDDLVLGRHRWETFLAEELPPLIDAEFNGSGANAVAGISMSGTSVLNLAAHHPGLYRAAASYSGCARTSDSVGQAYIRAVIQDRGKANVENMWGSVGGPGWVANDPYVNAAKLRGTAIYLSANTGLPGADESAVFDDVDAAVRMADQVVLGGGIEVAMYACTMEMAQRLAELKIPATVRIRETGTHSWGYWERELKASWPTLAEALS